MDGWVSVEGENGVKHGPHKSYSGAISDTKNSLSMESQKQQFFGQ